MTDVVSALTAEHGRPRDPAHDAPVTMRWLAHAPAWARVGGDPAVAGRGLLLFCGAVVVAGALYVGADRHEQVVLAWV